jgi:hypothetical protein
MSDLRIALVAEGPTDFIIIEAPIYRCNDASLLGLLEKFVMMVIMSTIFSNKRGAFTSNC